MKTSINKKKFKKIIMKTSINKKKIINHKSIIFPQLYEKI
jgi:hypothetical protein